MINLDRLNELNAARGPRWHVSGTIRRDEHASLYATTGTAAELIADRWRADRYYQVRVTPPVEYADIAAEVAELGKSLRKVRAAEADLKMRARALTVTANDGGKGIAETDLAEAFGVDRMTIRSWLGKR